MDPSVKRALKLIVEAIGRFEEDYDLPVLMEKEWDELNDLIECQNGGL